MASSPTASTSLTALEPARLEMSTRLRESTTSPRRRASPWRFRTRPTRMVTTRKEISYPLPHPLRRQSSRLWRTLTAILVGSHALFIPTRRHSLFITSLHVQFIRFAPIQCNTRRHVQCILCSTSPHVQCIPSRLVPTQCTLSHLVQCILLSIPTVIASTKHPNGHYPCSCVDDFLFGFPIIQIKGYDAMLCCLWLIINGKWKGARRRGRRCGSGSGCT